MKMMMTYMILFWTVVILLHEMGHYMAYIMTGHRPRFNLKWWGIEVSCDMFHRVRMKQLFMISYAGILTGSIPFMMIDVPKDWILVYLLVCAVDITIMLQTFRKENVMLIEKMKKDLAEAEKKDKEIKPC